MQLFEKAVEKFRTGTFEQVSHIYWANVCPACEDEGRSDCGRGMMMVHLMNRLCFTVPVEMVEVTSEDV